MASRAPPSDQYRPGPVPGSWVYLGTDPAATNTVEEVVPLEEQLGQLRISNEPENSTEEISAQTLQTPQTFDSFEILATE
jgi:hypothetical protein